MTRQAGTCFGFQLHAEQPIWFLREGTGIPLSIEYQPEFSPPTGEFITEWIPNERNPIEARLYEVDEPGAYALWVADAGWYGIDPPNRTIISPTPYDTIQGSIRLLGLPLLLCCLARGDTTLHAAAVEVDGSAILLAAPGRHGKTSLSASFAAAEHRLLTEDLSCLRIDGTGVMAVPGSTGLRIRPDMVDHLPLPGYQQVGLYGDRIVARPLTDVGDCTPVPVAAIVLLSDFGSEFSLSPVDPGEAVKDLWLLSFHLPNDADRTRKFAALVDVASQIPVWRLVRPADRGLLAETVVRIIENTLTLR